MFFNSPRKEKVTKKEGNALLHQDQRQKEAIRSVIHNYCILEKRQPTLKDITFK